MCSLVMIYSQIFFWFLFISKSLIGMYDRTGMCAGFEQRSYRLCFSKQEIFTCSYTRQKSKKWSYWLDCFVANPWFYRLTVTRNLVFFLLSWYLCFSLQHTKMHWYWKPLSHFILPYTVRTEILFKVTNPIPEAPSTTGNNLCSSSINKGVRKERSY